MSIAVRIPGLKIVNPDALVVQKYPTDYDLSWTADRFTGLVRSKLTTISSDIDKGAALVAPSGAVGSLIERNPKGFIQFGTPDANTRMESDATVSPARTLFILSGWPANFLGGDRHIFSVNGIGIAMRTEGVCAVTTDKSSTKSMVTLPFTPSSNTPVAVVLRRGSDGSGTLFARVPLTSDTMQIAVPIQTPGTKLNAVFGNILGIQGRANGARQLRSWPRALTNDEVDDVLSFSDSMYE